MDDRRKNAEIKLQAFTQAYYALMFLPPEKRTFEGVESYFRQLKDDYRRIVDNIPGEWFESRPVETVTQ